MEAGGGGGGGRSLFSSEKSLYVSIMYKIIPVMRWLNISEARVGRHSIVWIVDHRGVLGHLDPLVRVVLSQRLGEL